VRRGGVPSVVQPWRPVEIVAAAAALHGPSH